MNADHTRPSHAAQDAPQPNATADGLDGRFDAWARAHHAVSLQRLSARTQARLAQAQRPAASGARGLRPGWALPAALAAVVVLVVAVQLRSGPALAPSPTLAGVASPVGATPSDPAAALDENPDFYLWLASTDDVMPAPASEY